MRKLFIISLFGLAGVLSSLQAQTYQLNGFIGLGYSRFISDMNFDGLNKNGYSGTLRLMWQPEHLLKIGIETGYYRLYSFEQKNVDTEFGTTNAQSSLNAVPVFINIAMQIIEPIEIFAGVGPTFLSTSFESFGSKSESSQISTSFIAGANYFHDISDKIKIGGELKYYRINKIEDSTITLQFMFVYNLFDW